MSLVKQISNNIKSMVVSYNKTSICARVLIFIVSLLIVVLCLKDVKSTRIEAFTQDDKFLFKTGPEAYDDFYADIYDYLVFNNAKDEYEVGEIVNKTTPTSESKILDIGTGTGHHVAMLNDKNLDVVGIDISPSMIAKAKKNYPDYKFEVADAMDGDVFATHTFTHILCLYFTIYYFPDKMAFFTNCMKWLMPGGYLIVHLVDENKFDPILPPGNPLLLVSPQKYAKKRITTTTVKFTDFTYTADFQLDSKTHIAKFVEKFKNDKDGKIRKNEQVLYMDDMNTIVQQAQAAGFILDGKVDLIQCQYEYQYLYVFIKPN